MTLAPRSGAAVELAEKEVDWRLTAPVAARADFTPADGLVSRLATAQMTSIVSEGHRAQSAAELRAFGLETPALTVTVGAGSTAATLAIGAARTTPRSTRGTCRRPIVFTVEARLLTDLRKTPADLRVKDVFAFNVVLGADASK